MAYVRTHLDSLFGKTMPVIEENFRAGMPYLIVN